jgi:AcrR family transcriptional regulator
MPHPSQVQREDIVARASAMIETEGVEALSLARLAQAVGIKAPSLYHHFENKTALLRAVNLMTLEQLTSAISQSEAQAMGNAQARLMAICQHYRAHAQAHPALYQLAFSAEARPEASALLALAQPMQMIIADLSSAAQAVRALRGLWALIHGFVQLEIGGNFQRGGDLDADFEASIAAYLAGIIPAARKPHPLTPST